MTEQKKEYLTDALGEVEDRFVAEAVEYQKPKFAWKYTKELAAIAACAAVLFVSVNAFHMLPIGRSNETTNNAAERVQEAAGAEKYETGTSVTSESVPIEGIEESTTEYLSKGIQWEVISFAENTENQNAETEDVKEMCGYPILESIQTSSCVRWMSAEELLALDVDIFMGTVTDMQTYHVTGGMDQYFTVATVEIEDSIRGNLGIGDTCRIYLPFAEVNGVTTTTSLVGDLDKLEIGSRAIFMPHETTEKDGIGSDEAWLSYSDFAEYYFGEGMRFLFLETENGTSYETGVYEVQGGSAASLEDIAKYLREKISE